ncbi:MAG: pro-sigmaK processing inhibitor BofA family protein [Candidatus Micrarchaeota archaeon]
MSLMLQAASAVALASKFSQTDLVIIAGIMIFLAMIILVLLKRFIINSVLGIVAIIILNAAGIGIPLSLTNIIVTAIFGLVGIALLVILKLNGIAL